MSPIVDVIIPALNEQNAVGLVIEEIPKNLVRSIIVVDNGSEDDTPQVAANKGAIVLAEPIKGYGIACLKGIDYIKQAKSPHPDIIVFIDGDHSDYPDQMNAMIEQMLDLKLDLIIGSRKLGHKEQGSMTIQQVFGNWLATALIRLFYGVTFSDLGPFRAIRYDALMQIDMQDKDYGWTVEMQIKAAKQRLAVGEIPVNYRKRIGVSKISGTVRGTILAGLKIIGTIFKYL